MSEPLRQRPEVQALVRRGRDRYQAAPPDPEYAVRVLDDVVDSELDLVMVGTDRRKFGRAMVLSYDAARKATEAVMLAMGLRSTKLGGHAAVTDFAEEEFIDSEAERRDGRLFATARIARNADEYPQPGDVRRSEEELRQLAQACVRLVGHCRSRMALDARADLVPTDAKVAEYLRPPD